MHFLYLPVNLDETFCFFLLLNERVSKNLAAISQEKQNTVSFIFLTQQQPRLD